MCVETKNEADTYTFEYITGSFLSEKTHDKSDFELKLDREEEPSLLPLAIFISTLSLIDCKFALPASTVEKFCLTGYIS